METKTMRGVGGVGGTSFDLKYLNLDITQSSWESPRRLQKAVPKATVLNKKISVLRFLDQQPEPPTHTVVLQFTDFKSFV